jgi:hypothetical protein
MGRPSLRQLSTIERMAAILAPCFLAAEVDPVSAAYGDSPDILPMSVKN